MTCNVINDLENYNPLTEAITLAKRSSGNAFTHQRSSKIHYVVSMAQVQSVTPLPIENPLFHENDNDRRLLEKAITFEQQGFFTTPHITDSHRMASNLTGSFYVGCVVLENINYLIFSSYFIIFMRPFHDKILTTIFILFSAWLLNTTVQLQSCI